MIRILPADCDVKQPPKVAQPSARAASVRGGPGEREYELNELAAQEIQEKLAYRGRSFTEGEWVALLDAEVVATAPTLAEILARLRAIDPDPDRGLIVRAAAPVVEIIR